MIGHFGSRVWHSRQRKYLRVMRDVEILVWVHFQRKEIAQCVLRGSANQIGVRIA